MRVTRKGDLHVLADCFALGMCFATCRRWAVRLLVEPCRPAHACEAEQVLREAQAVLRPKTVPLRQENHGGPYSLHARVGVQGVRRLANRYTSLIWVSGNTLLSLEHAGSGALEANNPCCARAGAVQVVQMQGRGSRRKALTRGHPWRCLRAASNPASSFPSPNRKCCHRFALQMHTRTLRRKRARRAPSSPCAH